MTDETKGNEMPWIEVEFAGVESDQWHALGRDDSAIDRTPPNGSTVWLSNSRSVTTQNTSDIPIGRCHFSDLVSSGIKHSRLESRTLTAM